MVWVFDKDYTDLRKQYKPQSIPLTISVEKEGEIVLMELIKNDTFYDSIYHLLHDVMKADNLKDRLADRLSEPQLIVIVSNRDFTHTSTTPIR